MPGQYEQRIYLQLVERERWSRSGALRLVSATIAEPTAREPRSIVVCLSLSVPREAFEPLTVAAVDVPLEDIARPTVESAGA